MKLSRYKLIVSDLDGTLVKFGSQEISPTIKEVIQMLREEGIAFTIATGRSWRQTKKIVAELSITEPVIVQSGAIIMDPSSEKIIKMQPLRLKFEKKIRSICDSSEADLFCLGEGGAYFATQINTRGGQVFFQNYKEHCTVGKPSEIPALVVKHLFIGPQQVLNRLMTKITREIKPCPNLILWPPEPRIDDYFLEVFDPLASKGRAVQWLANYLKIRQGQVIAFGDGHNDMDLLKWAGLGVAMAEAPSVVSSKANLVIPGPEHDGLARFLRGELFPGSNFKY